MTQILSYEATKIQDLQEMAIYEFGLEGMLGKASRLKGHFDIKNADTGCRLTLRYVKGIRYVDIALSRKKGLYIYNRIVFGRLYGYTLPKLKYGFTDELKKRLVAELKEAGYTVSDIFIDNYYE